VNRSVALGLLLLASCRQDSREQLADAAYVARQYAEAYDAYAALAPSEGSRVWAKAAAAAAAAGALDSAVAAYLHLAADDPTRREEALAGLERVARLAERAGNLDALRKAVLASRKLAPERPIGRLAYPLIRSVPPAAPEALELLPAALAAAPDRDAFDALLLRWSAAFEEGGDCAGAAEASRGFLRRTSKSADSAGSAEAASRLERCALALGEAALGHDQALEAERWLVLAAENAGSPAGRRALLLLGDARVAQGDPIAAAIVWQRAIRAGADDSIGRQAARRIRALRDTDTAGDTTRMEEE